MKAFQFLVLVCLLAFASLMQAQVSSADEWNRDRLLRERKAMKVLTVWGNVNLAVGTAGALASENSELRWYHAMSAGFGAVNTTLGLLGLRRIKKDLNREMTLEEGYRDLRQTRNILLVNAGLDVGYIVTGLLIREKAYVGFESRGDTKRVGFGTSLVVQGAALLIFDSITAWQLSKSEIHISPVLTPNGAGVGFQKNFNKEKPVGIAWF